MAVMNQGAVGETYNIGGNNEMRNIDLVYLLCKILDEELQDQNLSENTQKSFTEQITFVADRPGHDLRYAINASKIKNELGWMPKQDHQSGFRNTVRWYLNNQSWWNQILDGSYRLERIGITPS